MEPNQSSTALEAARPGVAFTPDQIDLIRRTIAKGASDDELELFLHQCRRTGLDPFSRQIYLRERRQKNKHSGAWEITRKAEVSIDGLRVIAERTGEQDGLEVWWCNREGAWVDVWLAGVPPAAAKVLVYRKGCAHAFPGVARFDEYCPMYEGKPSEFWLKMPALMIAKCAEANALRKAFPHQLSDLYIPEEMAQADPAAEARANRRGTTLEDLRAEAVVKPDPAPVVLELVEPAPEAVNLETGEVAVTRPALPPGVFWIEKAWKDKSGTDDAGRRWTIYRIMVDGIALATFSGSIYKSALDCLKRDLPAAITTKHSDEFGPRIVGFTVMARPGGPKIF